MFKNIKINGFEYLFSAIHYDNEKPFIAYFRFSDRDRLLKENPLLDIDKDILPQMMESDFFKNQ